MGESFGSEAVALEQDNTPVYLPGLVAHWPACRLWRGESGLQRVVALAGEARVEPLASPAADGRAYGDMQHLMLLSCTLREFVDGSLERQLREHQPEGAATLRLYLAQSPVLSGAPPPQRGSAGCGGEAGGGRVGEGGPASSERSSGLQPAPLQPLMQDLGVPRVVQSVELQQVNFWASMSPTRSSLHYDPYHNLLCVARGSKTVWLVPPSCTPCLAPQPLTAESANHSPADLEQPDLGRFPGLAAALGRLQRFHLEAGDALFIPEGWWHQVDSTGGTLAVNYWWEGAISRQMGGQMDRYYFRRLTQSLVEQQKQAALAALPCCDLSQAAAASSGAAAPEEPQAGRSPGTGSEHPADTSAGAGLRPEHAAVAASLLAAAVAEHQAAGVGSNPPPLITSVVATLAAQSAQALLGVLLHLRKSQPQLVAHLLLHSLGPAGWELLSGCIERRQEELAAQGSNAAAEEAVGAACDELYSAVEDRSALLDAILAAKQAFAQHALRAVLETELAGCL